jgi:hypothetical protein
MDPFTSVLGLGNAAKDLFGGLVDRWAKAHTAKIDAKALVRLLRLEARRNLAILDVAVARAVILPPPALWAVPELVQTEIIETLLGRGDEANRALGILRKLNVEKDEDSLDTDDFLTNLYVRVTSLQSLALLNRQTPLESVQIQRRLMALRQEYIRLVKTLAEGD